MRRIAALILLLALLVPGCQRSQSSGLGAENLLEQATGPKKLDALITEAVFRYQIEKHRRDFPQAKVYFLARGRVQDRDPQDEVLRAFESNDPPVKGISECVSDAAGVRDKTTGAPGAIFKSLSFTVLNNREVKAEGGCFTDAKQGALAEYRVVLRGDRWEVTGESQTVGK